MDALDHFVREGDSQAAAAGALMVTLMGFFFGVILTRSAIAYSRRERTHPRPCHLARGLAVCHRRSSHHPPNGNTIWPPLSPYRMALELELPPKGSDGGGFTRGIAAVGFGLLETESASADHFSSTKEHRAAFLRGGFLVHLNVEK